jgi:hypothetical protein
MIEIFCILHVFMIIIRTVILVKRHILQACVDKRNFTSLSIGNLSGNLAVFLDCAYDGTASEVGSATQGTQYTACIEEALSIV